MCKLYNVLGITVIYMVYGVATQGVGDNCTENGFNGVCQLRSDCPTAPLFGIDLRMAMCKSNGVEKVVCCVDAPKSPRPAPVTQVSRPTGGLNSSPAPWPRSPTTTTTPASTTADPKESECAPIEEHLTAKKTGQKAWDKCIEYQKKLVYPCVSSMALGVTYNRVNLCKHAASVTIFGGTATNIDEFPHMVQLGLALENQPANDAKWNCAGTLISEWFILTAAHCTSWSEANSQGGWTYYRVKYAVVGALQSLKPMTTVDGFQIYTIDTITKHDDYHPPAKYNDLALLKTKTKITLSASAVPACLDVFEGDRFRVLAIGWGTTESKDYSDILLKVTLNQLSDSECQLKQNAIRSMNHGFNQTIQLCYGHNTEISDTCQGDSGGPLIIRNPKIDCMYSVIGIVANAKFCGKRTPGYYTKVSHFVPWIEKIVWPDN